MGENTKIEWTGTSMPDGTIRPGHTWNPWQGCRKVSPGCQNCYMFRDKKRFGQDPTKVVRSSDATFMKPYRWKDPVKVFVCSWSDFFIEDADEWREEAWIIMSNLQHLTFQILTKRPENIADRLPVDWPLKNVWLGVTAENQAMLEKRLPILWQLDVPVLFISCEPLLEELDFTVTNEFPYPRTKPGWVICGGESGPDARHMDPRWANSLMWQAHYAGVPFFMKQMSGSTKKEREAIPDHLMIREWPQLS